MKKFLLLAVMFVCATTAVSAQTADEKQASKERIEKLNADRPKDCGVKEIDDLATKCKSIAAATVAIDKEITALGQDTAAAVAAAPELNKKIQEVASELKTVSEMVPNAAEALKTIKNPMKLKPATNGLNYAKDVISLVGAEMPYQGKVVAAMISGQ